MGRQSAPLLLALAALTLAACAQRNQLPVDSTLKEDDDTFCRAGGKVAVGSAEYVACRRDRDAQRSNAVARADKKQRDLGEYMLNNPVRP
jgi:antitoxin component of RelBE/YafQ-DinJ toxin-antitoxin module